MLIPPASAEPGPDGRAKRTPKANSFYTSGVDGDFLTGNVKIPAGDKSSSKVNLHGLIYSDENLLVVDLVCSCVRRILPSVLVLKYNRDLTCCDPCLGLFAV